MFSFESILRQRKIAIGLSIDFMLEQMESILNYLEFRNYITKLFMLIKVINFTNVNYTLSYLTYKNLHFFGINSMF